MDINIIKMIILYFLIIKSLVLTIKKTSIKEKIKFFIIKLLKYIYKII